MKKTSTKEGLQPNYTIPEHEFSPISLQDDTEVCKTCGQTEDMCDDTQGMSAEQAQAHAKSVAYAKAEEEAQPALPSIDGGEHTDPV